MKGGDRMGIADEIAEILERMLDDAGGVIEIKRNDLARRLGSVPSQINYVITTRFTPDKGYVIESRRGSGGYVRIIRQELSSDEYLMHYFHAVGDELDKRTAEVYVSNLHSAEVINSRESAIIRTALLTVDDDGLRAEMLKRIVYALVGN